MEASSNEDYGVNTMHIGSKIIGEDNAAYIVAEMSANHLHDLTRARDIIRAAADSGADAVKLQTYTPDTMTLAIDSDRFRVGAGSLWQNRNLYELYREAMTPWGWHEELMMLANQLGMACFSTPFDATAVDFLEDLDVPAYKVASFEVVDIPLVERIAATGRPMMMSTGMATEQEIQEAVGAARRGGVTELALLRCTSAYPAPASEMDLCTIPDMATRFNVLVGLSDHTLGIAAPIAARALGACIIEKHLTLRRSDGGPDVAFSLEPSEFATMVRSVREAEQALGAVRYGPAGAEATSLGFRRSLYIVQDVPCGAELTLDNVRAIRPGDGLPPKHLDDVIGRHAVHDIERGTPLSWDLIA